VRIHLRPYLAAGYDPSTLTDAFMRTAQEFHGSVETLRRYLRYAVKIDLGGDLPFTLQAVLAFFARMESLGFPAVHHSKVYELNYHPVYRVVHLAYLNMKI
jgi:hypothetical protein